MCIHVFVWYVDVYVRVYTWKCMCEYTQVHEDVRECLSLCL